GTWRAGAGMGFWSLWGARTIRLRCAVFALSLGRSRQRWLGTRACRRRVWLGAGVGRGGGSLVGALFWRVGGGGGWARVLRRVWGGAAARLHGAVSDRCFGPPAADGEREA